MENTKEFIKKELYKQKPTADLHKDYGGYKEYTCRINIYGDLKVIFFNIPIKECDFEETVPAQLLIRWLQ